MNKNRIFSIDFIRAVCAVGIILFHCQGKNHFFMLLHANGSYGTLFVSIFFILSGAMLHYRYPQITSLKEFYYKRAKTIYPSYHIAYAGFYVLLALINRSFFYKPEVAPEKLVLSFIGLDGYTKYLADNYYILGEWFLGAIILIYLFYPMLLACYNKNKAVTISVLAAGTIMLNIKNVFFILVTHNLWNCMFIFCLGMFLFEKREFISKKSVFAVSAVISAVTLFVKLPSGFQFVYELICAVSLFITLYNIGNLLEKLKPVNRFFSYLGGISYQIFLLQHMVIYLVKHYIEITDTKSHVIADIAAILISVALAAVLHYITSLLLKTPAYKKFENRILDKKA